MTGPRRLRTLGTAAAALVTVVAVLGGLGWLPGYDARDRAEVRLSGAAAQPADVTGREHRRLARRHQHAAERRTERRLPAGTGVGRRIVFDQSRQRVWLVTGTQRVRRTYLVSGSIYDNLHPGVYRVYSRSRWAVGVDDSGVMEYYVRFLRTARSTIGFHTIPRRHGVALQTPRQLGTPLSHGCIRQRTSDAVALWRFAPVGTRVVVVA
ncbi:MAG: L,D-transpeptidase [Nocardioides sp.]